MVVPVNKSRKLTKKDTVLLILITLIGISITIAALLETVILNKVMFAAIGLVFVFSGVKELRRIYGKKSA